MTDNELPASPEEVGRAIEKELTEYLGLDPIRRAVRDEFLAAEARQRGRLNAVRRAATVVKAARSTRPEEVPGPEESAESLVPPWRGAFDDLDGVWALAEAVWPRLRASTIQILEALRRSRANAGDPVPTLDAPLGALIDGARSMAAALRCVDPLVDRSACVAVRIGLQQGEPLLPLFEKIAESLGPFKRAEIGAETQSVVARFVASDTRTLELRLAEIAQQRTLQGVTSELMPVAGLDEQFGTSPAMIGESPPWKRAVRLAQMSAARASAWLRSGPSRRHAMPPPMLVVGASGSGKELIAREAYRVAQQRGCRGKLVTLNCATIAPQLAASTLFGHEKGAFTDAKFARNGCFRDADNGVLFLDEVHRLPIEAQGGLLRVLETGEVEVLGASGPPPVVSVFVVAATNEQPEHLMSGRAAAGSLLISDLYHRLAGSLVRVPTLRERGPEDFESLLSHFERCSGVEPGSTFSAAERALLADYPWPGNVRELRRTVETRAMLRLGLGAECTLCGLRGHTHGERPAGVPERVLADAMARATRNSGGLLVARLIGEHFGGVAEDEVKRLRNSVPSESPLPTRSGPPSAAQIEQTPPLGCAWCDARMRGRSAPPTVPERATGD